MVTANMSSDLSAMRFVYADDTETSGEVSEAPAEPEAETPVVTESEPVQEETSVTETPVEETPAEVAPAEETTAEEATAEVTPAAEPAAEKVPAQEDTAAQTSAVKAVYTAGEGGTVSVAEETIDPTAEGAAFKGAVATAAEGYRFVNWTDASETVVSESAEFVPELKAGEDGTYADVSYTANFEQVTEEPAEDPDAGMVTIT